MTSSCRSWFVAFIVVAACGPAHKKGGGPDAATDGGTTAPDAMPLPHTLTTLTVSPTNPLIQLDLNTPGTQDFTVMGDYADGTTEDVTSQVTWTVANPAVGTMTGATLGIPSFPAANAVTSKITASLNGLDGLAQITVVAYRQTGAQQDFFFILPYTDPAGPQTKPLEFSTNVPALDVFFLMDTTGSMSGEISNLQTGLTGTVIPGIMTSVANSEFGVGAQEDFPVGGYGGTNCPTTGVNDQPLKLLQAITSDGTAITSGVNALSTGTGSPIGCGADIPEAGIESVYQAATGNGLSSPSPTSVPANHNGIGGVQFRPGTMPVIVGISDADSHAPAGDPSINTTASCGAEAYNAAVSAVAHTRQQTKDAMTQICARYVGIAAQEPGEDQSCISQGFMDDLATATGARVPPAAWDVTAGGRPANCAAGLCCTGFAGAGENPDTDGLCPVVFKVRTDGTDGNGHNGISASVVTGIQMLTRFATFDVTSTNMGVTTDTSGNPLPAGHTTADFIKMVTPANYTLPPPPPVLPTPTFDATTFHNVTPGTQVGFMVNAFNDFVMQTDQAQIFQATIQVLAGGCTPLDQRDVLILVPPQPITIARQ